MREPSAVPHKLSICDCLLPYQQAAAHFLAPFFFFENVYPHSNHHLCGNHYHDAMCAHLLSSRSKSVAFSHSCGRK